mgnify:CR=1 FL=1
MFNTSATMTALQSHLMSTGKFLNVQIGEPKQVMDGDGFVAGIFMDKAGVIELTLSTPVELHVLTVRIYKNALAEPQADWEIAGSDLFGSVATLLYGDFTLGGAVRNIDFAGENGPKYTAEWTYGDVSGPIYRMIDITIPCVVDSTTAMVA